MPNSGLGSFLQRSPGWCWSGRTPLFSHTSGSSARSPVDGRRTQHHLKAQLDHSSPAQAQNVPTKTEVRCRRPPVLNQAHSPPAVGISSWLHRATWLHFGLSGRTRKLYTMTSVYSERHFILKGVDKKKKRSEKSSNTSCYLAQQLATTSSYKWNNSIPQIPST